MSERVFGREVHRREEVDSTNDIAFELAAAGRPEGTVVTAAGQVSGRGRQGRKWHSPGGKNLYFSIVLRPERERAEWNDLPWIVAGSVAGVLTELELAGRITLKCPNDVLVDGKKIAGVLLENRIGAGGGGAVVAGVGMNVDMRSEDFPEDLRGKATSLRMSGEDSFDGRVLLERICRSMESLYGIWNAEGGEAARKAIEEKGVLFEGFSPQGGCLENDEAGRST
jgi:BirA family biotin operon repressor/biotin-[acetyl-CoA-carboxylase] ligase